MRAAVSSPVMVSLTGSQWILRPVRMAMSQRWLTVSERTAESMSLAGVRRLRTHSIKLAGG